MLLTVANGAPVLAQRLLGVYGAWPIDGGHHLADGRPVLGPAKTWRGLLLSMLACAVMAPWLGLSWQLGASFALCSMIGDMASSFIKRRLGRPASSPVFLLDQLPECVLPVALLAAGLQLDLSHSVLVIVLFVMLERPLSWLLFRLTIRQQPY
ncbi:MAG: CDP-archaeol synthase [Gammaproteobacteria bacterium]|nr:CDP-archaeol synthase [Gammaproteobacteria bacterium]